MGITTSIVLSRGLSVQLIRGAPYWPSVLEALGTPPSHERLRRRSAFSTVYAAQVAVAAELPTRRMPAAVLPEMAAAAAALGQVAVAPRVSSEPAHAASILAGHGVEMSKVPDRPGVAARSGATNPAPPGQVEGRKGAALAALLLGDGTVLSDVLRERAVAARAGTGFRPMVEVGAVGAWRGQLCDRLFWACRRGYWR